MSEQKATDEAAFETFLESAPTSPFVYDSLACALARACWQERDLRAKATERDLRAEIERLQTQNNADVQTVRAVHSENAEVAKKLRATEAELAKYRQDHGLSAIDTIGKGPLGID